MTPMTDQKPCRGCNAVFERRPNESEVHWAKRKFCTQECFRAIDKRHRGVRPAGWRPAGWQA